MNNFKKQSLIWGWLAFAISAVVYLLTMEPTASLWDCSEFIATSYKLEVGHPPGAPLFMMLNRLFTMFASDVTKVAAMVNTASAIASALTIAFLFWTIAHLARRMWNKTEIELSSAQTFAIMGAAFVGSMAYAFTDTFWFSAVEGEVYAQSSLFTALVFWAILKWENIATEPHANRWLVLLAYLMGLSIGVHLLNLLAIPAIVFVYYYKLYPTRSKAGWWKAFGVSIAILAGALYVIIPGTIEIGAWFDRIAVNSFGMSVNSGLLIFFVGLLALLGYAIYYTHKKGKVLLNTIALCITVMLIGYSTYASVVIRSVENPPMNSNSPSDPYQLLSFLNRDQYGNRPLIKGQYYSAPPIDYIKENSYYYDSETKKYVPYEYIAGYVFDPRFTTIFPRMYSEGHAAEYERWANMSNPRKIKISENKSVVMPSFADNLAYFFNYQVSFMYWRYFMWNFVGRQNDIQSQGEITQGNWLSGIKPIDALYLGPQEGLPNELANNKARNTYYFLPFLLGLAGLFYQLKHDRNNFTVVMWLFFMTGIAIILYLNQTPLQPRERDYAFAGSFYAFSIWIGLGVSALYDFAKRFIKEDKTRAVAATLVCLAVPSILIAENWDDHSRAERYVARDFGANYLKTTLPGSIILPYGDNDTFPLWYNQEVEGVRTDVKIMNLSYLQSDWYTEQMTQRTYDAKGVDFTIPRNKYYRNNESIPIVEVVKDYQPIMDVLNFIKNDSPTKKRITAQFDGQVTDFIPTRKIAIPVNKQNAIKSGIVAAKDSLLMVDTVYLTLKGNSLTRSDYMILDMIGTSDWSRPIYFTQPSVLDKFPEIKDYMQQDGLAYRLVPIKTKSEMLNMGRIDSDYLYNKFMNEFKYGNVEAENTYVDSFVGHTLNATQLHNTVARLASQLLNEGDTIRAIEVLDMITTKVPIKKVGYSYNTLPIIEAYYQAGQTEKADKLFAEFKNNVLDNLAYYTSFDDSKQSSISNELTQEFYYLNILYSIAEDYNRKIFTDELKSYIDAMRS